MRRTLNLRFAACLLTVLGVFGASVHLLHGYQLKRNASGLLDQARRARGEGRDDRAIEYLGDYLRYMPSDNEALAEYAYLLDKTAKSPKAHLHAYLVLDQVLRRQPERQDLRRRLAELAIKLYRFHDAEEYLVKLRQEPPKDAEIEELLGRCQQERGNFRQARNSFENAIKLSADRIDSYLALAYLFHDRAGDIKQKGEKLDGNKKATETLAALIAANKNSFKAYLGRAQYLRRTAPPESELQVLVEAEKDLAEARRLAPGEADLFLTSAEFARASQDFAKVRECLRLGCDKHPTDARMYRFLASIELEDGKIDEAAACLRRGLENVPKDRNLQWDLANVLVQQNKTELAGELVELLRKDRYSAILLDYLEARLLLNKKEWLPAAHLLERSYPLLATDRKLTEQAGLQLAFCYERLGDADRASAAYSRVLAVNKLSAAARIGVARTLALTGQLPQAIDQYQQVLKLPRVPASVLAGLVRLLILRNRQEAQPNWEEVTNLLTWAAKEQPSMEITILQAEADADRGNFAAARQKLEKAGDEGSRSVEVWVALAALEDRQRRPALALALLDEAERRLGDRVELRLARIRHWGARKSDEARKELAKLSEKLLASGRGLDKFTTEQQQVLLRALASAQARAGNTDEARRLWSDLAEQQKDALDVRIAQFDLAIMARDDAGVARILEDMKRIEGPEGTIWRYGKAYQLISQAGREQDADRVAPELNEAHELLLSVASRRPRWSRVAYSEALIDDLRGKPDAALANYRRAIQLGERIPHAIQRTAELLTWKRRYTEAYALFRKLPPETPLSEGMQKLYAELALEGGRDIGHAVELAEKTVAADSTDYRKHLWLGRIHWATRQPEKAEVAFRRAVQLADNAPETWVALIQYLATDKRTKDAEAEIEKARAQLPTDQAALALAQCYEAVGKLDRAQEFYHVALEAQPEDISTLRGAAGFALRTNKIPDAVAHLEKIVQLKYKDRNAADAARRVLAVVKTVRGDYQESRKALELVGLLEEDKVVDRPEGETVQERRTQATLLALQKSRREQRRAIPILEGLIKRQEALPEDRFLLAQVYEAMDDWPKAQKAMLNLLFLPGGNNPRHLAYYARILLRHNQPKEAEIWLDKLEKQQDDLFVVTEIRARIATAQGNGKEAVRLLERLADHKDANRPKIAALLEELKETAAAERLYRAYVEATGHEHPENALVLAQFLGRQQKISEALDLCQRAWRSAPPAASQVCLMILAQPGSGAVDYKRVERWLEAEAAKSNVSSSFSTALAHVKNLQGRYDEAESIYRKAIDRDPRDATALNNLAYLLALRRKGLDEALQLVSQSFDLLGPRPTVLDTRAVVLLSKGASEQAIKDLKQTIAEQPSGTAYFHLAQAHYQARDLQAARLAFQQAKSRGLQAATLHPLEGTLYQELTQKLGW